MGWGGVGSGSARVRWDSLGLDRAGYCTLVPQEGRPGKGRERPGTAGWRRVVQGMAPGQGTGLGHGVRAGYGRPGQTSDIQSPCKSVTQRVHESPGFADRAQRATKVPEEPASSDPSQRTAQRDTETQRRGDTETQRHRDTETQRDRETETQRHRDTERQRHRDTETQRHRDTETQRRRDTETQRHRDTETQRHRDTKTQRHRDTETHRKREMGKMGDGYHRTAIGNDEAYSDSTQCHAIHLDMLDAYDWTRISPSPKRGSEKGIRETIYFLMTERMMCR